MTKKKITGILFSILLVVPLLLSLVTGVQTIFAQTVPIDTQDIVLHKRIFRDRDYVREFGGAQFQNDGQIVSGASNSEFLELSDGLNGAKFVLVDVTAFYHRRRAVDGIENATQYLQDIPRSDYNLPVESEIWAGSGPDHIGTVVAVQTTSRQTIGTSIDEDGLALFSDVPKRSGNQNAVYMIVETEIAEEGLNVDLTSWAEKMLVAFPIVNDDGERFDESYLHLYPKNLGYARDPWFVKIGRELTGDSVPLAGSEFALYRMNGDMKEYVYIADPTQMPSEHSWKQVIQNDLGHADYDDLIRQERSIYESQENGVVSVDGGLLIPGTYYFEEVKATPEYLISGESRAVEVFIPDTWDESVMVNGQEMLEPEPDWTTIELDYANLQSPSWEGIPIVTNDRMIILEKELVEDKDDFAYGDNIQYELTLTLPQFPEFFTEMAVSDTANEYLSFIPGSMQVSVDGNVLTEAQQDALMSVTIAANNSSWQASIDVDFLKANMAEFAGQELVFAYQMKIDEGAPADVALENVAQLIYKHADYDYNVDTDEEIVYTGGRRFVKVDMERPSSLLANAEFAIQNANGEFLQIVEGETTWTTDVNQAKKVVSAADGTFAIEGLAYGDYFLQEIIAPAGYQVLSEPVAFSVSAGSFSVGGQPAAGLVIGNRKLSDPPVDPGKPGRFPSTGEASMNWLLGLGLFFILVGVSTYSFKTLKQRK